MKAITVRNLPPEVAKTIREKARTEGLSLNRTVVKLLAEATGHGEDRRKKGRVLHHDLDKYAGMWTKQEAEEFDAYLKEQRAINPEDWR